MLDERLTVRDSLVMLRALREWHALRGNVRAYEVIDGLIAAVIAGGARAPWRPEQFCVEAVS